MSNTSKNPLATCTGRILVIRDGKDGKDGIGIKSADVVFAVGSRKDVAPADGNGWKTTFSELSLTADGYVWTCTKTVMTDNSVEYSGKYCLGACSDFADIIELYALGDDNVTPPESGWKQSYTPVKGKWLWTKNELHFQNSTTVTTTKAICIGYFANDGENGTSFNLCGSAMGHYDTFSAMKKKGVFSVGDTYLLNSSNDADGTANNKYNKPSVASYMNAPDYDWYVSPTNVGDAYRIDTDLWVCTETTWVNMGSIQGPEGEPGEDAIWVTLSPNQVSFDSDEKGMVKDNTVKSVGVTVFLGSKIVTQSCQFAIASGENYDMTKASIARTNGTAFAISINSSGISTKKITDTLTVSCPFSSLTVKVSYLDYVKYVTINIVVDTSVVDGYFRSGIEGLEAKYTTINTNMNGVVTTLVQQQASITANAKQIKQTAEKVTTTEQNLNGVMTTVQTWQQAGVVTRADFSGLFAQYKENNHLVTSADISAFITEDEVGNMISVARINADQVNINANHMLNITGNYMTIDTDNFKLSEDGTVTCNKGVFNDAEVNGIITSNGEDFTIKIDNGVIYFITDEATYHLGLNSSGKPDWLSNKPYVYSETFYYGNLLSDNPSEITLYTTDHEVYYSDVNLTRKTTGTYYRKETNRFLLTVSDSIYYASAGPFIKLSLYARCAFSNGVCFANGYVATGYNFYLNDNGSSIERYTAKQYFKPVGDVGKNAITQYSTVKRVGSSGDVSSIGASSIDVSSITDSYIYPLQACGSNETAFSNYTTMRQDSGNYVVQNFSI